MNKNYKKAIINEMFDRNVLNSEADREKAKEQLDILEQNEELTGIFDEDVSTAIEAWKEVKQEEERENNLESLLEQLHVGYNFVPGLGFGYVRDEEDLEHLKRFIRGQVAMGQILSELCGGEE